MKHYSELTLQFDNYKRGTHGLSAICINGRPVMQEKTDCFNDAGFYTGYVPTGRYTPLAVNLDATELEIIDYDGKNAGIRFLLGNGIPIDLRLTYTGDQYRISAKTNDERYMRMSEPYRRIMLEVITDRINQQCCN